MTELKNLSEKVMKLEKRTRADLKNNAREDPENKFITNMIRNPRQLTQQRSRLARIMIL